MKEGAEGTPQLFFSVQGPDHCMFEVTIVRQIIEPFYLSRHGLVKVLLVTAKRVLCMISLHLCKDNALVGSGERMTRSHKPSLFISPNLICIDVNAPCRVSGCASMDHVGRVDVRHESIVFKRMCVNVGKADDRG